MSKDRKKPPTASLEIETADQISIFRLSGILNAYSIAPLMQKLETYFHQPPANTIQLDAGGIESCNTAGLALLAWIQQTAGHHKCTLEIINLREDWQTLLESAEIPSPGEPVVRETQGLITQLGEKTAIRFSYYRQEIAFIGHLGAVLIYSLFHPRKIRFQEFWWTCEQTGANSAPIVILLGVLFGLILAFSSTMPMKQFGVEIYAADLVAYVTIRVLGPFITAVILAGRTGSAFAAELGTMKINNEIDALEVMALDPVRFLVVPRFLATVLMTPLLAVIMDLAALIGAGIVIISMGYPFITYWNHAQEITNASDIFIGLFKSFVYGALIAGIGTMRGLQTGLGPGAVGIAATRAVVSSIVALVAAEGIFSVLLYFLNI